MTDTEGGTGTEGGIESDLVSPRPDQGNDPVGEGEDVAPEDQDENPEQPQQAPAQPDISVPPQS